MHLRTNWKQDEQEFTGAKVDGLGGRGIKEDLQFSVMNIWVDGQDITLIRGESGREIEHVHLICH